MQQAGHFYSVEHADIYGGNLSGDGSSIDAVTHAPVIHDARQTLWTGFVDKPIENRRLRHDDGLVSTPNPQCPGPGAGYRRPKCREPGGRSWS